MRFFVLRPEGRLFGTKWAYADILDPFNTADVGPRCPRCNETVGSLVWQPPYRVKLSSSKPEKWGDFLWGAGLDLAVSERFKIVYEEEGLRGIERFGPLLEVVRMGTKKTGDLTPVPPAYYLVEVAWNGANLDDDASGMIRTRSACSYCRRGNFSRYDSIVIERESWNGADIMKLRGLPGTIVVSQRFAEVSRSQGLRNVLLVPAEKVAYDEARLRFARGDYIKD